MALTVRSFNAPAGVATVDANMTVVLPATISANDVLYLAMVCKITTPGACTFTPPAGWTIAYEQPHFATPELIHLVATKIADGTEDGATVTFVGSVALSKKAYCVVAFHDAAAGDLSVGAEASEQAQANTTTTNVYDTPALAVGNILDGMVASLSQYAATVNTCIPATPTGFTKVADTGVSGAGTDALVSVFYATPGASYAGETGLDKHTGGDIPGSHTTHFQLLAAAVSAATGKMASAILPAVVC